jgi:hypothetical protein
VKLHALIAAPRRHAVAGGVLDIEIGRKLLRLFDACEKWSEHMA